MTYFLSKPYLCGGGALSAFALLTKRRTFEFLLHSISRKTGTNSSTRQHTLYECHISSKTYVSCRGEHGTQNNLQCAIAMVCVQKSKFGDISVQTNKQTKNYNYNNTGE